METIKLSDTLISQLEQLQVEMGKLCHLRYQRSTDGKTGLYHEINSLSKKVKKTKEQLDNVVKLETDNKYKLILLFSKWKIKVVENIE